MARERVARERLEATLTAALAGDAEPLETLLAEHSALPGPRGNLELADDVGALLAEHAAPCEGAAAHAPTAADAALAAFAVAERLASVTAAEAPVNDPREFLAFCGTQAAGSIAAVAPGLLERALAVLGRGAVDERWRTREAAARGMQALLGSRRADGWPTLERWARSGDALLMRAAVAAVAEPALLATAEDARAALALHREVLGTLPAERRGEPFRVLRQALGYSVSVVAAALPDEGFAFLRELAARAAEDADVRWIVRENLGKARLAKKHPERTREVADLLG